jgi:glycopeptide antibiotics resistance protein
MFWRSTWPAFVWAIIVLILCGVPGRIVPELTFLQWLKPDKVVHLVLFGVQSYLLMRGFEKQSTFPFLLRHAIVISVILSILFGITVEIMQDYVFIQRSGDVRDAIANAIGALFGWWIYRKNFKVKHFSNEA